jgi:transcriptional/translational regulatory protein YebC/TACO1
MFESRGVVTAEVDPGEGDEIALAAIDAGAEDFKLEDSYLELYASPENLESLRSTLEQQGVKVSSAELSMVPSNTVLLDAKVADQTLRLLDHLEELDDIQKVYTNADFPDEALEQYKA